MAVIFLKKNSLIHLFHCELSKEMFVPKRWEISYKTVYFYPLAVRHFLSPYYKRVVSMIIMHNIRIFNGNDLQIENSVTRVTVRYHKAFRVMPNSYPE